MASLLSLLSPGISCRTLRGGCLRETLPQLHSPYRAPKPSPFPVPLEVKATTGMNQPPFCDISESRSTLHLRVPRAQGSPSSPAPMDHEEPQSPAFSGLGSATEIGDLCKDFPLCALDIESAWMPGCPRVWEGKPHLPCLLAGAADGRSGCTPTPVLAAQPQVTRPHPKNLKWSRTRFRAGGGKC